MKRIGYVLIAIGLALFIFAGYSFFKNQDKLISPVPDDKGIKVIFVSPDESR